MGKNITPSKDEILEFNLKTAQDLNMFRLGFIKYELPEHLQHKILTHYYVDNTLMIEVKKVRGTYYVNKDNLDDLQYVLKDDVNPLFLRVSKRKEWSGIQDFSLFY